MRIAGKAAAEVLDFIAPHVREGVSTETLNTLCHEYIVGNGDIPLPLTITDFRKVFALLLTTLFAMEFLRRRNSSRWRYSEY